MAAAERAQLCLQTISSQNSLQLGKLPVIFDMVPIPTARTMFLHRRAITCGAMQDGVSYRFIMVDPAAFL